MRLQLLLALNCAARLVLDYRGSNNLSPLPESRTHAFLIESKSKQRRTAPNSNVGSTVAVGSISTNAGCWNVNGTYQTNLASPVITNVIYVGSSCTDKFWYDNTYKKIKTNVNGTDQCLVMTQSNLLVATGCPADSSNASASWNYDPATKFFISSNQCLSMSKPVNASGLGGILSTCMANDARMLFDLPAGTSFGQNPNTNLVYVRPCNSPLGLSLGTADGGNIPPLNASSYQTNCEPDKGRLFLPGQGWCAKESDANQWLEITFVNAMDVTAIAVQSGSDPSKYVGRVRLQYKPAPDLAYVDYASGSTIDVSTNGIMNVVKTAQISPPVRAVAVRLLPTDWFNAICMRVEVYGCFSITGNPGLGGAPGAIGTPGHQGTAGVIGATGDPGLTGDKGPAGSNGVKGSKGAAGSQGSSGTSGPTGDAGPLGATGRMGDVGELGASGPSGTAGPSGPQGRIVPGSDGLRGATGTAGGAGASGPTGQAGRNGTNGTPGVDGASGSPGAQGKPGFSGAQGSVGGMGALGSDGRDGINGRPGSKGAQGDFMPAQPSDIVAGQRLDVLTLDVQDLGSGIDAFAIDVAQGMGKTVHSVLEQAPVHVSV